MEVVDSLRNYGQTTPRPHADSGKGIPVSRFVPSNWKLSFDPSPFKSEEYCLLGDGTSVWLHLHGNRMKPRESAVPLRPDYPCLAVALAPLVVIPAGICFFVCPCPSVFAVNPNLVKRPSPLKPSPKPCS